MGNLKKQAEEVQSIFSEDLKKTKKLESEIKRNLSDSMNAFNKKNSDANKYDVARNMNNFMQYIRNSAIAVIMFVALILTGCNKGSDYTPTPPDTRQTITQELRLSNFDIKDYSNKGFDLNTFIWNWNPESYNLIFTNPTRPSDSKTMTATINQLKTGLAVELFRGVYNIDYVSTHSTTNYSQVDGKIAMNSVIVQGSPIDMTGQYADFMIVVELPFVDNVHFSGNNVPTFTKVGSGSDVYFYTFSNPSDWIGKGTTQISVNYTTEYMNISGKTDFNIDYYVGDGNNITGINGHCYHYISSLGAVTNLTFPQWIEDRVVIN